ncbi:hypothetical protein TL16_g08592 [Triparma laevis f. inornata]|uniref:Cold-shock domain-containing protein n=1 Tax=Triparma laevis f. inornata TaxID=1714386 RepID=A0A9W7B1U6_9STRA|nr:hypothetical protein TL16_g08592 [Triparma laevis f. inornata]
MSRQNRDNYGRSPSGVGGSSVRPSGGYGANFMNNRKPAPSVPVETHMGQIQSLKDNYGFMTPMPPPPYLPAYLPQGGRIEAVFFHYNDLQISAQTQLKPGDFLQYNLVERNNRTSAKNVTLCESSTTITKNYSIKVQNKLPHAYICEYTDPTNGSSIKFLCTNLDCETPETVLRCNLRIDLLTRSVEAIGQEVVHDPTDELIKLEKKLGEGKGWITQLGASCGTIKVFQDPKAKPKTISFRYSDVIITSDEVSLSMGQGVEFNLHENKSSWELGERAYEVTLVDVTTHDVVGEGEGMVFEGKVELEGEAYSVDVKEARDGDYVRFKASVALWEGGGKVATDIELVVRAVERRGVGSVKAVNPSSAFINVLGKSTDVYVTAGETEGMKVGDWVEFDVIGGGGRWEGRRLKKVEETGRFAFVGSRTGEVKVFRNGEGTIVFEGQPSPSTVFEELTEWVKEICNKVTQTQLPVDCWLNKIDAEAVRYYGCEAKEIGREMYTVSVGAEGAGGEMGPLMKRYFEPFTQAKCGGDTLLTGTKVDVECYFDLLSVSSGGVCGLRCDVVKIKDDWDYGLCVDVNMQRHFGFIAYPGGKVFVHLSQVLAQQTAPPVNNAATPTPGESLAQAKGQNQGGPAGKYVNGLFIPNNQPAAPLKKGDQVRFKVRQERGKDIAVGVEVLPEGSVDLSFLTPNLGQCRGWILVEANNQAISGSSGMEGSGVSADGVLMVVEDKTGEVTIKKTRVEVKADGSEVAAGEGEGEGEQIEKETENDGDAAGKPPKPPPTQFKTTTETLQLPLQMQFRQICIARGKEVKRGQYVAFSMGKKGLPKDVQPVPYDTKELEVFKAKAVEVGAEFKMDDGKVVPASQVVGCDATKINAGEEMEGFIVEGKVWGLARSRDLRLAKSTPSKTRPKLNLSVKSEMKKSGAGIMAQSGMAKATDGTKGFTEGWTTRESKYLGQEICETAQKVVERVTAPVQKKKRVKKKKKEEGEEEGEVGVEGGGEGGEGEGRGEGGGEEEGDGIVVALAEEVKPLKINSRAAIRF